MATQTLTAVITREDDRYVAQYLEVDVSSFGDTPQADLSPEDSTKLL
ncbi:hypothetical protein [Allonocardiopsis opalescens]|uniref:Uncharacterized protein n=1 Tax=Allonocardiopsis opalescens TaxID=1144618 RepID=A0A2T0PTV1_9ACTN|nr:hypothetical protein [Allonocardiopsis opalescens]PRX92329.1 hypothetical protein CLV72_11089 [Allonocardiopsis opalescens]